MNMPLAFIQNFGMTEILLILFILVLIFGARKLPELGRGIGEGIKNFRSSMAEGTRDAEKDGKSESK